MGNDDYILFLGIVSSLIYLVSLFFGAHKKFWTRRRLICMAFISFVPFAIGVAYQVITQYSGSFMIRIFMGFAAGALCFLIAAVYTAINYWVFFSKEPYKSWFNIRDEN